MFFAGVDQTFIGLFWDARSCETRLAPDEVILKEQARTDLALLPRQQIFCVYLFARGDGAT